MAFGFNAHAFLKPKQLLPIAYDVRNIFFTNNDYWEKKIFSQ